MAKAPKKGKATEAAKPKKEWDFYMNTQVPKDGNPDDAELVAAFTVKGGISKAGKPYLVLDGFSKTLGGLSMHLGGKKIGKLLDALEAAGYLGGEAPAEELEADEEDEEEE